MNSLFKKLFHIRYQSEAAPAETPNPGDGGGGSAPGAQQGSEPGKVDDKPADDPEKPADGKPQDGDTDKDKEKDKPQGAPEKYEFQAPEGSDLDKDAVAQFEPIARELNLTQEQAQKLVDLYGKEVMPKMIAQQADNWKQQVADWAVSAKEDKEIGGDKFPANMEKAKQAMEKFSTPALRTYLEDTGLGNHPELIRLMVNVGRAMSEDTLVTSHEKGQRSAADVLYGKN